MLKGHPVIGKEKSHALIEAFIAGAPRDAEGHVFFGVKESNHEAWADVLRSGENFYFIDNAYFDQSRGKHYRVTRNALQFTGRGESTGDRFDRLGIQVHAMRDADAPGYVLALPQSDVFMRCTIGDVPEGQWLAEATRQCQALTGWKVKVRHWSADKQGLARTLPDDLRGARLLITHTSAGAITALLAGVPVRVSELCCAHRFNGNVDVDRDEIRRWAEVLADNEFSMGELASGHAWEVVNRG